MGNRFKHPLTIRHQFLSNPQLFSTLLDDLEFNQDGVNNDVIIINRERVCRFPKTDRAKEALVREAKVLQLIHHYIDVSVSLPQFECLEDDFVSYLFIRGKPLSRNQLLKLDLPIQEQVLEQLGSFYRQLHSLPTNLVESAGVLASPVVYTREEILASYDQIQQALLPHLWKHQRTWIEEYFEPLITGTLDLSYDPVLIHGDLGCYHILFDPDTQAISGLIDFGTAGIGSRAIDIAGMLDVYGETIVKRIAQYYPSIVAVIDQARFMAGGIWLQWALIGIQENRTEFLLAHLGHLVLDIQPVGTSFY